METLVVRFLLGLFTAALIALCGWAVRMNSRVAVLEAALERIPKALDEIKDELKTGRVAADKRAERLYSHIDGVRQEVKADLDKKADKAAM